MATAANPSLFGMLGDEQYMQRQLEEQRAEAASKRSLGEQLNYMSSLSGQGLARGLAGAFGVETTDPTIRMASQLRGIASQFDTTTPEGIRKYAMAIKDLNPNVALQASRMADEMDKAATDTRKAAAEASAKEGEVAGKASRVQMLKDSGLTQKEAEGIASNDTAFANFVKGKQVETPPEYAAVAGSLGFGAKPYLADYTKDELAAVEARIQQKKVEAAREGRPTTINQQESAFSKKLGELQATDLAETKKTAVGSAAALKTLENMEGADNVYGGPLAGANITASQFLGSLGLLSPQQTSILANSEVYDKDAKKLVLQDLGGKLGAQISDKDRDFIEATIPQLKNSPAARQRLIAKLKEIHESNIQNYRQMQSHANKYGNLNDFDPTKLYGYGSKTNTAPKMNAQDEIALQWAEANPKDPRAAQIKQRLGK